jgi:hypothetical protein
MMPNPSASDPFVIDAAANAVVDGAVQITGYTLGGKEADPAIPMCLAKKSFDPATGISRYWLKRASNGPDAGHLFNPHSPNFDRSTALAFHAHLGRGQYEFRRVNQAAFDAYLAFLQGGNLRDLRQAERESVTA